MGAAVDDCLGRQLSAVVDLAGWILGVRGPVGLRNKVHPSRGQFRRTSPWSHCRDVRYSEPFAGLQHLSARPYGPQSSHFSVRIASQNRLFRGKLVAHL